MKDLRIIGGQRAQDGQFPYLAALMRGGDEAYCVGALLNNRWIITSRRCMYDSAATFGISVGSTDQRLGDRYEIEEYFKCEGPCRQQFKDNELMLVKSKEEIKFTDMVKPLPIRSTRANSGEAAVTMGWGWITQGQADNNQFLHYLEMTTLLVDKCRPMYPTDVQEYILDSGVCGSAPKGQGICSDYGAVLVVDDELVGVLMAYTEPCANGVPDAFLEIQPFQEWVDEVMKNN